MPEYVLSKVLGGAIIMGRRGYDIHTNQFLITVDTFGLRTRVVPHGQLYSRLLVEHRGSREARSMRRVKSEKWSTISASMSRYYYNSHSPTADEEI